MLNGKFIARSVAVVEENAVNVIVSLDSIDNGKVIFTVIVTS